MGRYSATPATDTQLGSRPRRSWDKERSWATRNWDTRAERLASRRQPRGPFGHRPAVADRAGIDQTTRGGSVSKPAAINDVAADRSSGARRGRKPRTLDWVDIGRSEPIDR